MRKEGISGIQYQNVLTILGSLQESQDYDTVLIESVYPCNNPYERITINQ